MTQPLDSLLREALSARRPGDAAVRCLDEERLAAWFEGTLTPDDRRTVEAHAADCARCQMLLGGMARVTPAPAPRAWWRGSAMKWIVPLATAAASTVVWLNLSNQSPSQRASAPVVATNAEPREAAAAATAQREAEDPASPPREAQDNAQLQTRAQAKAADVAAEKELRRQEPAALSKRRQEPAALSKDERQAARNAAIPVPQVTPLRDSSALPGAAAVPPVSMPETPKVDSLAAGASPAGETARFRSPAPAAPPPAAAAGTPAAEPPPAVARRPDAAPPSRMTETVLTATPDMLRAGLVPDAARQIVIPSADPRIFWRIRGLSNVQRSTDGGVQWQTQTSGGNANFNAGSSPSSNVCWIVGSGGIVMLSSDGRTWRRLPFPETVELVAVTATDERSAVVTSADGRRFITTDGGRNWKR